MVAVVIAEWTTDIYPSVTYVLTIGKVFYIVLFEPFNDVQGYFLYYKVLSGSIPAHSTHRAGPSPVGDGHTNS